MAHPGFTISQPVSGGLLEFVPPMGSIELDQLIDRHIVGPMTMQEKRARVTIDFCEWARVTGQTIRYYPVAPPPSSTFSPSSVSSFSPSSLASTIASPTVDSGYGSSIEPSPVLTSWGSPLVSADGRTSARKPGRPPGRPASQVDLSDMPGMRILTRDGRDVTHSTSRTCKTKEQRDHTHLMRILKACDDCRRKKSRCDPSHRARSNQSASDSRTAATLLKSLEAKAPPVQIPRLQQQTQPPPPIQTQQTAIPDLILDFEPSIRDLEASLGLDTPITNFDALPDFDAAAIADFSQLDFDVAALPSFDDVLFFQSLFDESVLDQVNIMPSTAPVQTHTPQAVDHNTAQYTHSRFAPTHTGSPHIDTSHFDPTGPAAVAASTTMPSQPTTNINAHDHDVVIPAALPFMQSTPGPDYTDFNLYSPGSDMSDFDFHDISVHSYKSGRKSAHSQSPSQSNGVRGDSLSPSPSQSNGERGIVHESTHLHDARGDSHLNVRESTQEGPQIDHTPHDSPERPRRPHGSLNANGNRAEISAHHTQSIQRATNVADGAAVTSAQVSRVLSPRVSSVIGNGVTVDDNRWLPDGGNNNVNPGDNGNRANNENGDNGNNGNHRINHNHNPEINHNQTNSNAGQNVNGNRGVEVNRRSNGQNDVMSGIEVNHRTNSQNGISSIHNKNDMRGNNNHHDTPHALPLSSDNDGCTSRMATRVVQIEALVIEATTATGGSQSRPTRGAATAGFSSSRPQYGSDGSTSPVDASRGVGDAPRRKYIDNARYDRVDNAPHNKYIIANAPHQDIIGHQDIITADAGKQGASGIANNCTQQSKAMPYAAPMTAVDYGAMVPKSPSGLAVNGASADASSTDMLSTDIFAALAAHVAHTAMNAVGAALAADAHLMAAAVMESVVGLCAHVKNYVACSGENITGITCLVDVSVSA